MIRSTGLSTLSSAIVGLSVVNSVLGWGFPYGQEKVRGVNLGGWLVLEVSICLFQNSSHEVHPRAYQPWITPTIFDNTGDDRVVDEWTFGQYVDNSTANSVLKQHWDSWITENDFAQIAAAG